MSIFVYKQTEPQLWTVGHYYNDGKRDVWDAESDHGTPEEAAERVRFLNGGAPATAAKPVTRHPNGVSATDETSDNPPNVPIAVHLPTFLGHLDELDAALELAADSRGDYLGTIETTIAELRHIASDADSTARMPLGVCGARLHDLSGPWSHLFVCTKTPGHVDAGDAFHEDETRRGAPAARWTHTDEPADEAPEATDQHQHFGKDEILARLRMSTEPFTLYLAEGDTAYDVEVGDTLLGPARITYSYGTFPGTTYRATVLGDDDGEESETYDKVEDLVASSVPEDRDGMESMYPRDREDGEGIDLPSYGD